MSWIYSVVLAGLMFSTGSDLLYTNKQNGNYTEAGAPAAVKLDETEKFEQTYPLSPNGRVRVSNVNGSITVEASDKPEVRLEAVKIADSKETLDQVDIKIDSQPNSFSVEVDYDNLKNKNGKGWNNYQKLEVQFRLIVPRTAVLDEIETVNGSVTVSNFVNTTKVSAVNGQVRASNLRGNASLSTVNGTVNADFDALDAGSKISLETVNGQVNLLIPSDSNATIKADTLNGKIVNDFGLPVRKGEYVGRDLYGRLGSGETRISLNSVNGGLFINRKNDGKNANPPVNLLNDKKASEDWDDEGDLTPPEPPESPNAPPTSPNMPPASPRAPRAPRAPRINTAKINADVQRAVKEAEKERKMSLAEARAEVEEAIKELRLEMKDIDPEIAKTAELATLASLEALKDGKNFNSEEVFKKIEALREQIEALKLENLSRSDRLADLRFAAGEPGFEKKSETFAVKGTPKVTINANGCDVKVRGWDKSEVQYSVKKLSRSRNEKPIDANAKATDSDVKITVVNQDSDDDNLGDGSKNVFVEVFVPKKSNLKIVTDGEIRLENLSGELDVNGADASVNVRDADGKLKLVTGDALVRIIGFRGDLDAQTDDGEMFLEGDFTKINARAADGKIYLTLSDDANALINTNNEVEFLGENNRRVDVSADSKGNASVGNSVFVREKEDVWRIGKGDNKYSFTFQDGNLFIRSPRLLSGN